MQTTIQGGMRYKSIISKVSDIYPDVVIVCLKLKLREVELSEMRKRE